MCKNCDEIDNKIDHYRWLASQFDDKRTIQALDKLIQQYEDEKHALHPEQE
jgi:hypothetical protein